MTPDTFKKHIIELVSKKGIPLSLFSSHAFIGLSGETSRKRDISIEN